MELLDGRVRLIHSDARIIPLSEESVDCCVTSPPYWGLRDYLGNDGQLGMEKTPEEYVQNLVAVFREVKRVLKPEGTLWLNLGDCYCSIGHKKSHSGYGTTGLAGGKAQEHSRLRQENNASSIGCKHKDLVGIPWMVAFALRADGWYLRQDIIWCLSGGTWIYARTQKGDAPMMIRDVARLDPGTIQLWNGEKWTWLRGISKSKRKGNEIELVLRSGERISCTPTHRFPTTRGLLEASNICVGDALISCRTPEPEVPKDCALDEDAAWFAGLYIAEGSRSGRTIQISGHLKEEGRWDRVCQVARKFGGSCTRDIEGNKMNIRVYGKVLDSILAELVTGKTAHDKGFSPVVWRYSDRFLTALVDGYLGGDGHDQGFRWRLGFCRNYNLERDLRTVCARLGYTLTLNLASVKYKGKQVPTFRGELRKSRSGHCNEKDRNEVVAIRKARCREVYDLGVEDDPHVFALASGVLTHNSKPNAMPESVKDRCTRSHEYIFMLSKSARYYYDAEAISEPFTSPVPLKPRNIAGESYAQEGRLTPLSKKPRTGYSSSGRRNKRDVWHVATHPYPGSHFATFPPKLIEPCVLAGCPENGLVLDPFGGSGTTGRVAVDNNRRAVLLDINYHDQEGSYLELARDRVLGDSKPKKKPAEPHAQVPVSLLTLAEGMFAQANS